MVAGNRTGAGSVVVDVLILNIGGVKP